jgi:hypothetical protein
MVNALALGPADEGPIAVARMLADAMDAEMADPKGSRYTVASIAGRLTPVLLDLRQRGDAPDHDGGEDAELDRLRAEIRDAARS